MSSADAINNFETNTGTFSAAGRRGGAAPRPGMARRVMDVEDVLRWAYIEELPKDRGQGGRFVEPSEISPMFKHADLGTRVDSRNYDVRLPAALGTPHPDALRIEAAVGALAELADQAADDDMQLAPDFAALGIDEAKAVRRALGMMPAIVARCAKLKRRPFWHGSTHPMPVLNTRDAPMVVRWEPQWFSTASGGELEHEVLVSVEQRKGDYPFGAFSPLAYYPDPQSIAEERAEYLVWWGALDHLAAELAGKLDSIAVLATLAPQRPWLDDGEAGKPPRVFSDVSAPVYRAEARQTAEAHRKLGQRRQLGMRGPMPRHLAPRRVASAAAVAARG